MLLQKEVKESDEAEYIKTSQSMQKMIQIAERLTNLTPEIIKCKNKKTKQKNSKKKIKKVIPSDSLLKPNRQNLPKINEQQYQRSNQLKIKDPITGLTPMKPESSAYDCVMRAQEVEQLLEEQKAINENLKQELEIRKERCVKRELEYRKIIEELQNEIRQKAVLDTNEAKKMEVPMKYHQEILERVNQLQLKTSLVLIDQEKTRLRLYIKRKLIDF
ncbi:hypothetical protein IMG5_124280 [Ichthyophthirius multifiliis]|uniref:Uncharacterized protein n=1 Tax=Ichthyophthirius multifiliis TaxID=5932 RepID=G0QVK2_ICHMU|nr:hypothetical protein IMG5_124280 [Ichthyophthirius multifiliis]EGR30762.1 hypothetical protein IMG5_124280 [Ichthyophthirius multifiliis]|eukprot:XP_004032349.1 hypothetical protein IMG5_124280 [Ichthyophthirius multifiliis]